MRVSVFLCLPLFLPACIEIGAEGSNGTKVCQLSNGSSSNVYSPYATWRKVSGFDEERTQAFNDDNPQYLTIETGGVSCFQLARARTIEEVAWIASYEHDIDEKSLDLTYIAGENTGQSDLVNYSFSGNCGEVKMTLNHSGNNQTEVFELHNADPGEVCSQIEF